MRHFFFYALPSIAILLAILWLWPTVSNFALLHAIESTNCTNLSPETEIGSCIDHLAALGTLGDSFAPLSVLFSGLAILAVAFTLLIERRAFKESKKPIIICTIDDETGITFDEAQLSSPYSLRLRVAMKISAMNDVALNVETRCILKSKNWIKELQSFTAPYPLNESSSQVAHSFDARLDKTDIEKISGPEEVFLDLMSTFTSVEGVRWESELSYKLAIEASDRDLIKAITETTSTLRERWPSGARASGELSIVPQSWKHRKATPLPINKRFK